MIPAMLFDFNGVIVDDKTGTSGNTHPHNPLIPDVVEFVNRAGTQYL